MKLIYLIIPVFIVFQSDSTLDIFLSNNDDQYENWYVVDDGVMGGLSKGNIERSEQGHLIFKGYVTTENNGGFSSMRYGFNKQDIERFTTINLRLKGDGKRYQFRVQNNRYQQFSYIKNFDTSGEWETISIPLDQFYPSFRGYRLNRPNFDGQELSAVAILIGNKTKESFNLELERIWLD